MLTFLMQGLLICMHARVATHRLTLAACAVSVHILLIFYLHFGFHVVVEGKQCDIKLKQSF